MRLRKKLAMRPVNSTARGGNTTQKKYRNAFTFVSWSLGPLVERWGFLPSCHINVLQLLVFNHWIRKQIAAEAAQSRFEITVLPVDFYLHVFPDPNTADFRHAQVPHGITHCITLRIKHRSLWHDDDLRFH